jgi:hypothetical protein
VVIAYSDPSNLVLKAMARDEAVDSVMLRLLADGVDCSHVVKVRTDAGIRSIVFSEPFEIFLRPYCSKNPKLVKDLVDLTLEYVDRGSVTVPRTLV